MNDEYFGVVRWCKDDIEAALIDRGLPTTDNNIEKLYKLCNNHWFADAMIEVGWDYIYGMIEVEDGWDE